MRRRSEAEAEGAGGMASTSARAISLAPRGGTPGSRGARERQHRGASNKLKARGQARVETKFGRACEALIDRTNLHLRHLVSGATASVVARTLLAPLERVKVRHSDSLTSYSLSQPLTPLAPRRRIRRRPRSRRVAGGAADQSEAWGRGEDIGWYRQGRRCRGTVEGQHSQPSQVRPPKACAGTLASHELTRQPRYRLIISCHYPILQDGSLPVSQLLHL